MKKLTLGIAVLLVGVLGSACTEAPSSGMGESRNGACFSSGDILIMPPDPDVLAKSVDEFGRDASLAPGVEAAPDAAALAARTGGALVTSDGPEAAVRYGDGDSWRIDTFTRFETADGDHVWFLTGSRQPIPCPDSER